MHRLIRSGRPLNAAGLRRLFSSVGDGPSRYETAAGVLSGESRGPSIAAVYPGSGQVKTEGEDTTLKPGFPSSKPLSDNEVRSAFGARESEKAEERTFWTATGAEAYDSTETFSKKEEIHSKNMEALGQIGSLNARDPKRDEVPGIKYYSTVTRSYWDIDPKKEDPESVKWDPDLRMSSRSEKEQESSKLRKSWVVLGTLGACALLVAAWEQVNNGRELLNMIVPGFSEHPTDPAGASKSHEVLASRPPAVPQHQRQKDSDAVAPSSAYSQSAIPTTRSGTRESRFFSEK
ncbi:putative mitochondrial protein [Andalucia godoyi]|uniref:Putative mitochondrial protein n=1 Tax=Andalucia godoyi TaxID=505711 RepID=A0A8K0AGH1_ANDGO|nr:putative mitochondrial protein [Andalucia godoyi]|eukprot:ANDGO_06979.mRNA.1 putative mitochondrial protein